LFLPFSWFLFGSLLIISCFFCICAFEIFALRRDWFYEFAKMWFEFFNAAIFLGRFYLVLFGCFFWASILFFLGILSFLRHYSLYPLSRNAEPYLFGFFCWH
jgi:hypothetical protein